MFGVLGGFLLLAPWTAFWLEATVTLLPEGFHPWALSGWMRGVVSGLGALDLFVAAQLGGELWRDLRTGSRGPDGGR